MRSTDLCFLARRLTAALVLLVAASIPTVAEIPADAPGSAGSKTLLATVERLGRFSYAGDPVMVRLAVFNTGDTAIDNASGLDLVGHTEIIRLDEGKRLEAAARREADGSIEPRVLHAGGFFGFVTDLGAVVKGLDKPGKYKARLLLPGADPAEVDLVVIERYDPSVAYRAIVETEYGILTFDLLGAAAPRHVNNLFDLANQGWYDGSVIQAIVKGVEIHGGDLLGDGRSNPGYTLDPEISGDLRHERGTLSMLRTGPTDHGSQFIISLGENRRLDGNLTIFGKISKSESVLSGIENLPTTGTREAIPYRPLKQVTVRSIRVTPAPSGSVATAAGGEVTGPAKAP